jgi:hypothetical protein
MHYTTTPNPRELLPPLLACLPTSFFSSKPPPALLPLLSPLLRQRVSLLSGSGTSPSDSWLLLLNWNAERAAKLPEVVERVQIEPHPVSGEIELDEIENIKYRRLDSETLHSRLEIKEFELLAIYLFCLGDGQPDGEEAGWKLAELRSLEDLEDGTEWFNSIDEANEGSGISRSTPSQHLHPPNGTNGHSLQPQEKEEEEDDDDSYWAAYDRTPNGPTPTAKRSPAPPSSSVQVGPTNTELEYFARYMNEVQPAMDPHDPEEEGQLAPGESTLNGHTLTTAPSRGPQMEEDEPLCGYSASSPPELTNGHTAEETTVHSPRPSSSRSARSVEHLEQRASSHSQAEVGIKQHISTDIKSLYRLARSAGIERSEFERIIKTELDCLSLMELE